jgi:hypothetical protein
MLKAILITSLFICCLAAFAEKGAPMTAPTTIPFRYGADHFLIVPVTVAGVKQEFVFDTGIGINLISKTLCKQLGCKETGKHTGKRMSGQELTIPTTTVSSFAVGLKKLETVPVGVFDMDALMPEEKVGGFVSLGFFEKFPISVDYTNKMITFETEESLKKIRAEGVAVPIKIDRQDDAVGIFLPLRLPNDQETMLEVDTGSQALILDEKFMKGLGISPADPKVKRRDGTDETGHKYARFFTTLSGSVHLPSSKTMGVDSLSVMFQKIIYDGLVGHYFLREFRVTYDLPRKEMIFRKPETKMDPL